MSENLEEKKPIYKKWWIWVIVAIVILGIGSNSIQNNTQQATINSNVVESKNYEHISYTLQNDSTEKIEKLAVKEDISSEEMKEIYNKKKADNTNFKTYTIWFFSDKDKGLKSNNYELGYVTSKDGEIIVENKKEIKEAEEEKKAEEEAKKLAEKAKEEAKKKAEQEEQEFKESCKKYSFEELARNPDKIEGTNVKITGEVIQALYGNDSVDLRINITKEGTYTTYYTDTVYVVYYPEDGEDKILEDDIVTVYGTAQGDYSYTSTIGAKITLPLIYGKYVTINK